MEITPLTHLLQVSEKSCRKPRNTLKTQLHFVHLKHQKGVKVWEKLRIIPAFWKKKRICGFSPNILPFCFITQGPCG